MPEKNFYTIEEVALQAQRNRGTIYNRMKLLHIKPQKFPMDRKTYINAADAEKIKAVIQEPWRAQELGAQSEEVQGEEVQGEEAQKEGMAKSKEKGEDAA